MTSSVGACQEHREDGRMPGAAEGGCQEDATVARGVRRAEALGAVDELQLEHLARIHRGDASLVGELLDHGAQPLHV